MNTYPNDDDDDDDDDEDDDVDDDEDDDVDEDEDEDEAEDDEDLGLLAAKLRDFDTEFIRGLKLPDLVELVRLILCIFCVANSFLTLVRAFSFAYGGLRAAVQVHNNLLKKLVDAPVAFFDQTPSGRILNRCYVWTNADTQTASKLKDAISSECRGSR